MSVTTLTLPSARAYKASDPVLLSFARSYLHMFSQDRHAFFAIDPEFDEKFTDSWNNAIVEAENTPDDKIMSDTLYQQTKVVLGIMKACRIKYHHTMYFANEAFGNNNAILNEFGKDNYLPIRMQQDAMVKFMTNLYSSAQKYSADLIANSCTPDLIEEILRLKDQLARENALQQKLTRERTITAAQRVERYDRLYSFCQKVNRASKKAFADNYHKIQDYLLPASENEAGEIIFRGVVIRQENDQPIQDADVNISTLNITSKTDEFGVFAFAKEIPRGAYNFTVTADGRKDYTGSIYITGSESDIHHIAMVAAIEQ